jgi:hypothetical protein
MNSTAKTHIGEGWPGLQRLVVHLREIGKVEFASIGRMLPDTTCPAAWTINDWISSQKKIIPHNKSYNCSYRSVTG